MKMQSSSAFSKARDNYERYAYARDHGHAEFVRKADTCDSFYQGMQWEESIRRKLEAQGKPVLTINKILATVTTVQGELLNTRADVDFKPAEMGDEEVAFALGRVYLQVSQRNQLYWLEQDVADDGFITGRGYYDCRVEFDENFLGHIVLRQLNPRNVIPGIDAESYDPDDWPEVFLTKWYSPDEIERKYGKEHAERLRHRQFSDFMYGYDSISRMPQGFGQWGGLRTGHHVDPSQRDNRRYIRVIERQYWENSRVKAFVNPEVGDMRNIPANWDRNRIAEVAARYGLQVIERDYKQIRWTVSADTELLHDDVSPYKNFTVVPYFPYFRRGQTMGLVESMLSLQELLNKTASQELHIVNSTANSGWMVKRGSLTNMNIEELEQRGAETGLVVEWDGEDPDVLRKIQPNNIPQGIDRLTFKTDNWLKEIAGVSDSMRGFDRADVAAKAIEAKQQRGSMNLAKPFDNLLRTRQLMARRVLNLVQTYYTEPRIVRIVGERPTDEVEEIPINVFDEVAGRVVNDLTIGRYDVVVATRPPRETMEADQYDELLRMRELGVQIPDHVLVEHSHLERKRDIIQAMGGDSTEDERAAREQQAQIEAATAEANLRQATANAELAEARARKVHAETEGAVPDPEAEERGLKLELEALRQDREDERARAEMEFKREIEERRLDQLEAYQNRQLDIQEKSLRRQTGT